MQALGPVLGDAWRLALPYFRSEEKWAARGLLASIITLNLMLVGASVVLNYWNGAFYDSLQNKNWELFMQLLFSYRTGEAGFMPGFVPIVAIFIPISIYRTYLNQLLQIRWRRWLTDHLLTDWLSDRAYYTIGLTADPAGLGTDNPDQRIAEDLRKYVEDTLRLGLGLLSNVVSLFNFALILWTLSGAVTLFGITAPRHAVVPAGEGGGGFPLLPGAPAREHGGRGPLWRGGGGKGRPDPTLRRRVRELPRHHAAAEVAQRLDRRL